MWWTYVGLGSAPAESDWNASCCIDMCNLLRAWTSNRRACSGWQGAAWVWRCCQTKNQTDESWRMHAVAGHFGWRRVKHTSIVYAHAPVNVFPWLSLGARQSRQVKKCVWRSLPLSKGSQALDWIVDHHSSCCCVRVYTCVHQRACASAQYMMCRVKTAAKRKWRVDFIELRV